MEFKIENNKFVSYQKTYENDIQNQKITNKLRLEPRSNIIPAQKTGVYYKNKEESCFLQSLNGEYDFSWQKTDCLENFYENGYDTSAWDKLPVPSMWQFYGYGKFTYTNVYYPIPLNPPYICCENPVGYYKKKFIVENKKEHSILHFGGVDNAFYVYINGNFAGFSKGSRIPAEFDVSNYIVEGENIIAVKVFTYSDATYLENQDLIMANGIFRDVYLLHTEKNSVWDYRVKTTDNSIEVTVELFSELDENYKVIIDLDGEKAELTKAPFVKKFVLENPRLWNAEEPNLYNLTISVNDGEKDIEIHSKKVGIMHTKIVDGKFLLNGKPIYVKGVNRHELNAKSGRAITVAQIEKELKMIKENNLNAIRCSHYTNNPAFYEICSELGIYVMDEADIETHGAYLCSIGMLSDNPEWEDAFIDRVKRMVIQNKNEVCIFMRSMGNEAGAGINLLKCQKLAIDYNPDIVTLHDFDGKAPIPDEYNFKEHFIVRTGYCSKEQMEREYKDASSYLQIEYAHAMGNSPGYLEGYWDFIYSHEKCLGGFVWEFKNHGIYREDENKTPYYAYGGDFGDSDEYHWNNFCLDGYLTSDGTPKPTWYELKEVSAPAWVKFDDVIIIKNTNDFKTLSYLTLKYEVTEDGKTIFEDSFKMPDVMPHKQVVFDENKIKYVPKEIKPGAKYYLNLNFYDGEKLISKKQIELPYYKEKEKFVPEKSKLEISANDDIITVFGDNFKASFENGMICYYEKDNEIIIDSMIELNFTRAATDNDGILQTNYKNVAQNDAFGRKKAEWLIYYIHTFKYFSTENTAEKFDGYVSVNSKGKVVPNPGYHGFVMDINYKIYNNGLIKASFNGVPYGNLPKVLPRIGVKIPHNSSFENTMWLGRGKGHSYRDMKASAPIGLYNDNINNLNFMYDYPQETGNHENCEFVCVSNEKTGLSIIGNDSFAFSYHNFTLENLSDATHKNEVKKSDKNYLYIDYAVRPLGSNSCGPEPEPEFELTPKEFDFSFVISNKKTENELITDKRIKY